MYKVFINKLVVDGIHGLTEKEKHLPQRFQVDITIETESKPYLNDSISDAVDYREVRRIATSVIQDHSFCLLETIANEIAEKILMSTSALAVTVNIYKLDIWGNAVPGVSINKEKIPAHIDLLDFDIKEAVNSIATDGAFSFPILPKGRREKLIEEAYSYQYQPQPEIVGKGQVQEQISSVKEFPEDSLFWKLRNDFVELLIRKFSTLKIEGIFKTSIDFNDMSLQKYDKDSIGITPHKDGKSRVNIICVFNLIGKAEFALCDDRRGSNPKFLDTTPGNIIMLRAPGFFQSTYQPFHYVRNIIEERIVFGLRQRTKEEDKK